MEDGKLAEVAERKPKLYAAWLVGGVVYETMKARGCVP